MDKAVKLSERVAVSVVEDDLGRVFLQGFELVHQEELSDQAAKVITRNLDALCRGEAVTYVPNN